MRSIASFTCFGLLESTVMPDGRSTWVIRSRDTNWLLLLRVQNHLTERPPVRLYFRFCHELYFRFCHDKQPSAFGLSSWSNYCYSDAEILYCILTPIKNIKLRIVGINRYIAVKLRNNSVEDFRDRDGLLKYLAPNLAARRSHYLDGTIAVPVVWAV
jgi:hypothetical protein